MNIYIKNRIKIDVNFRLIVNTRNRIYKSLKSTKSSSTLNIMGIDFDSYRKWIEDQFTPEMNWNNIDIDHVKPICLFDVSKFEDLKDAFSWKNTQPIPKQFHQQKGTKVTFLDWQLQLIKAYQFVRSNEERLNQNFHDKINSSPPIEIYETNKTIIKCIEETWSSHLLDMNNYGP